MSEQLSSVLFQFPLLAIFIWFTFEMQKRYQASIDEWLRSAAEERVRRDQEWRAFLLDQRVANVTGLETLSTQMRQIAECLATVNTNVHIVMGKFTAHDERAEEILSVLTAHDAATTATTRMRERQRGGGPQ